MTTNYSAWRRASLSCSQKIPPLCPCWKQEKADQGELKGIPGTAPHGHCQGQVQMQDTPLLCTGMCRPHLGTQQCQRDHSWQLRLCSSSCSWPEISPKSWATERTWGEAETPGSVMRACYSCNPRAQREIDFLRNWFSKVLNWRQARIQSVQGKHARFLPRTSWITRNCGLELL